MQTSEPRTTLFEAIGGEAALTAAVDLFYDRVLTDPALAGFFTGADVAAVKRHQKAFLMVALHGPGTYLGRSMAHAHAHLHITGHDFDRVAGHLVATLAALDVPTAQIEAIVARIAPLRPQIVKDATPTAAAA